MIIVIGELSEDWKKKWHEMIPGERFCDPYELKGVRPSPSTGSNSDAC